MRGLILSGGKGTRLRPITHSSAKQLVPVANMPILHYAIEAVVASGITDVGIIIGETGDEVRASVGDGSRFGATDTYIPQAAPRGLAHAVLIAREFLGDDRFVVILGDNLIRDGITSLVDECRAAAPDAMILLARVPEQQRFGIAELDGDRVVRLVEKSATSRSELALVGIYLFSSRTFDAIDRITPRARGELEITDAIQRLIDDGASVVPHVIGGWWKDTGRPEDLLEANRIILDGLERSIEGHAGEDTRLDGTVVVAAGAEPRACMVRDPATIGAGTVAEDAYIGPFTSIAKHCVARRAKLEHSIVLAGSRMDGVKGRSSRGSSAANASRAVPQCGRGHSI